MNDHTKGALQLKLTESEIDYQNPWSDDALGRSEVAKALTNLIRDQESPFVISLHGRWGTGKTFLLRRWQKQLENDSYQCVYFNAWEDDFCDDPLTAIIGQLSGIFSAGRFKDPVERIKEAAKPLLMQSYIGVLNKLTGVNLNAVRDEIGESAFQEYANQRKQKDDLKARLTEFASEVRSQTCHPLVFVIDELDRCRPTFTIELLERVKHIFDVPNVVFVFGINREELCVSIQSVYGNINADVYARRFFDMEFVLPNLDAVAFCKSLIERYKLKTFFDDQQLSADRLIGFFPIVSRCFDFSLRDMDHCIRTIVFVRKNTEERRGHGKGPGLQAILLSILVSLRLKNSTLYHEFVRGDRKGSEVMDFIDDRIDRTNLDDSTERDLDVIEAYLYLNDKRTGNSDISASIRELRDLTEALKNGDERPHMESISKRTQISEIKRVDRLFSMVNHPDNRYGENRELARMLGLIELYQPIT